VAQETSGCCRRCVIRALTKVHFGEIGGAFDLALFRAAPEERMRIDRSFW
jgi:hypothetical protein